MEVPRTPIFGLSLIEPGFNARNKTCPTKTNECKNRGERKLWAIHNFMMWFLWVALMATIICSVRYFRHYWRKLIYVHVIAGIVIFFAMTAAVIMAWVRLGGMDFKQWPAFLENVATFIGWWVCISGFTAWYWRKYLTYEWGTLKMLNALNIHRWSARIFCIGVQGLIMFAIIDNYGFTSGAIWVSCWQFIVLAFIFICLEVRHQRILREEVPYVQPEAVMNLKEFEVLIKNGRKLMILDDLVLDVADFIEMHPGGKFVIEHTVGTDIAKFFYGGYCLEDNNGAKPAETWRHTNYARMIANDLAVARFDCMREGSVESFCRLRADLDNEVNGLTRTFTMQTSDMKPRHNYKAYYPGLKYLTRHFWIRNMAQPEVIRHYTTCNAMETRFYNELVRCLKDPAAVDTFDKKLLNNCD